MTPSVVAVGGVVALGGGVAAGLAALVVAGVACLVVVGLVNGIRVLGELLDALEVDGPTTDDDASRLLGHG
jgi:hypothetical protein